MGKIITKGEEKIAREFFKGYTNSSAVKRKLYGDSDSKTLGVVQRAFGKWRNRGYIYQANLSYVKHNESGEYLQTGPKFILNMNLLFDYLEGKQINLSKREKNYINLIFSYTYIRKAICELFKDEGLIEAIFKFYLKFLIFPCALRPEYVKQTENIRKDKEFFEKVNKYLLENSKYKNDLRNAVRNPTKIKNTKIITKMCKENLKEDSNSKKLNPIKYSQLILRSSYLLKHDDRLEGKFIKRLNKKIMKGFGVDTI